MKKALTLVEVLVVVLIIGVLAMIAIPRQAQYVNQAYLMQFELIKHRMIHSAALIDLHRGEPNFVLGSVTYEYDQANNVWLTPKFDPGSGLAAITDATGCDEVFKSLSHESDLILSGHSITSTFNVTGCTFQAEDSADFSVTYTFADSKLLS